MRIDARWMVVLAVVAAGLVALSYFLGLRHGEEVPPVQARAPEAAAVQPATSWAMPG